MSDDSAPSITEVVNAVAEAAAVQNDTIQEPIPNNVPERKLRVVLALPGRHFADSFLISLVRTLHVLWERGVELILAPGYSSFVSFSRMKTLGLDVGRGVTQKPFNGMEYDVWVTVDSDIVWDVNQFLELVESTKVHPAVFGAYRMSDLTHFATVRDWDIEYFKKNNTFQFLRPEDVKAWKEETNLKFMEVAYAGLGFAAIRKDALDKLNYPYFDHPLIEIQCEDGRVLRDMCSEDVAFCRNLQAAGVPIYLNTDIVVGHSKELVI